ncbi:MAG: phosphoserine phosphatase SerB [Pseudomonadota bacterium]|jgi:phosphoserine phosphatase
MLAALTLVSPDPAALNLAADRASEAVSRAGAVVKDRVRLGPDALDLALEADDLAPLRDVVNVALADLPVDVCLQAEAGRKKRLFIADMDSTMISCECLDELADYAGLKAEIAAITERAMRGELAFEPALRERVSRLKGLPLEDLERCYVDRVRLNPGARTLVRTLAQHGVETVLVSGGFEFFTSRVAAAAGFASHQGNRLLDDGAHLTGEVADPILGREAKLEALHLHAARLGVDPSAAVAIGDGANDLAMIGAAGLGLAYRAKPVVAAEADARIDHADLTAVLYFQGYASDAFVRD